MFLPVSRKDMEERGWDEADFVLVTADAYVDHHTFGTAIIGRLLERFGYRVAVLAQPDYKSADDFRRFGRPRLGFLINGGAVDSCAVEIPFSFSCDLKDDAENQIECTGVAVTDVVSRVRREGETEVCASISLQLECKINCAVYGVGHIEVGQERELDMGGISVFTVAKGETLWDAAKALNVSERDIISQNPYAEKGVKEGDKIVVFRCMG